MKDYFKKIPIIGSILILGLFGVMFTSVFPHAVFAAIAPATVANDTTKQCGIFQPDSSHDLPSGWRVGACPFNGYEKIGVIEGTLRTPFVVANIATIAVFIILTCLVIWFVKKRLSGKSKAFTAMIWFMSFILVFIVTALVYVIIQLNLDKCFIMSC